LEISGSSAELRQIAHSLTSLSSGESCDFLANADVDPAPYTYCLERFEIQDSQGPVRVVLENRVLRASGSAMMLKKFASFFDFSDDAEAGAHSHHEFFDGNEWIAPDSHPLVICVE
jgi:hypothetical protein